MNYSFDAEKVFFTSDTHFYHESIIDYCHRPFRDVEQMNEVLIANWNSVVGKDDIVFHLGDFCLGGATKWSQVLDRLNGKIYLILGNHDLRNIRLGYIQWFEHVTMQMFIEVRGQGIYLNHNPFLCYGGAHKNTWQLFGHVHSGPYTTDTIRSRMKNLLPMQYDVGVDNNDFTPVSFEQVKEKIGRTEHV